MFVIHTLNEVKGYSLLFSQATVITRTTKKLPSIFFSQKSCLYERNIIVRYGENREALLDVRGKLVHVF